MSAKAEFSYEVDTSVLGNPPPPMAYRTKANLKARHKSFTVASGMVVCGTFKRKYPGWLRCNKNLWLPMQINGHTILKDTNTNPVCYMVIEPRGAAYRSSPKPEDRTNRVAPPKAVVTVKQMSNSWIQTKETDLWLPITLNGRPVCQRIQSNASQPAAAHSSIVQPAATQPQASQFFSPPESGGAVPGIAPGMMAGGSMRGAPLSPKLYAQNPAYQPAYPILPSSSPTQSPSVLRVESVPPRSSIENQYRTGELSTSHNRTGEPNVQIPRLSASFDNPPSNLRIPSFDPGSDDNSSPAPPNVQIQRLSASFDDPPSNLRIPSFAPGSDDSSFPAPPAYDDDDDCGSDDAQSEISQFSQSSAHSEEKTGVPPPYAPGSDPSPQYARFSRTSTSSEEKTAPLQFGGPQQHAHFPGIAPGVAPGIMRPPSAQRVSQSGAAVPPVGTTVMGAGGVMYQLQNQPIQQPDGTWVMAPVYIPINSGLSGAMSGLSLGHEEKNSPGTGGMARISISPSVLSPSESSIAGVSPGVSISAPPGGSPHGELQMGRGDCGPPGVAAPEKRATPPRKGKTQFVLATHDTEPKEGQNKIGSHEELNLKAGDIVKLIEDCGNGWWSGEMEDGSKGVLPFNYVQLIECDDPNPSWDNIIKIARKRCTALYDFSADQEDELALFEGEELTIFVTQNEHWYFGKSDDGRTGIFPSNYVQLIT